MSGSCSSSGSHVAVAEASSSCHRDDDDNDESLFLAEGQARVPALRVRSPGSSHASSNGHHDLSDDNTTRPGAFTAVNPPSGSGWAGHTGPHINNAELEGLLPLSCRSGTHAALAGYASFSGLLREEPGSLLRRANAEFPPGHCHLLGGASSNADDKRPVKLVLRSPRNSGSARSKQKHATTTSGNGNDKDDDEEDDDEE